MSIRYKAAKSFARGRGATARRGEINSFL